MVMLDELFTRQFIASDGTRGDGRMRGEPPTANIFCRTGPGGGIKPDCSAHSDVGGGMAQLTTVDQIRSMKPKALKVLAATVGLSTQGKTNVVIRGQLARKLETRQLVAKGTLQTTPAPATKPATHHEQVLSAFRTLDKYNQVSIADLHERTGLPLADLHRTIDGLRRAGVVSVSQLEKADDRLLGAAIKEGGQPLAFISLRTDNEADEEAVTAPDGSEPAQAFWNALLDRVERLVERDTTVNVFNTVPSPPLPPSITVNVPAPVVSVTLPPADLTPEPASQETTSPEPTGDASNDGPSTSKHPD